MPQLLETLLSGISERQDKMLLLFIYTIKL